MEVEKRHFKGNDVCWFIKSLFVANDQDADNNAQYMIIQFFDYMQDADDLCANVHPLASDAIAFWERNGFSANLGRSIFSNSDEQVLTAYCKTK